MTIEGGVRLRLYSGIHMGAEIALTEGLWVFGRDDSCDIVLADPGLAPRHAVLDVKANALRYENLDGRVESPEGEAPASAELEPGRLWRMGPVLFAWAAEGAAESLWEAVDAERAKMPGKGLSALQAEGVRKKQELDALNEQMRLFATQHYKELAVADKAIQDEFNYMNVWAQTDREAENRLMLLEGFVPAENAPAMEQALDQAGYYYRHLELDVTENIPIKLRNNAFSRLFEPITRMFSLPNYTEFDPTPFFAPFFMLFFGLCFGDGGYGLLVILVCAYFKRKVKADYKPYLSLFQYFGLAAVIVGTLTGSFFGIALANVPALAAVKDYFVSSDNLMTFSIIIGLVQIVFGKIVAALQTMSQQGTKYGIAPLAWVFTIVAFLCALGLPMLDVQIPETVKTVCYAIGGLGLLVAFLYNSPGKNVFLNIGTGLWNTYNVASGLLGDTLSYIRLFAIGLTGSILGGVFNTLAIDMTEGMNIVLRIVVMLLILVFGHAINFGLCTISSLVHPLRLIFVEYYKNAEFSGGGKEYRPFKKA